jgi:hypothetical protein
MDGAKMTSLLSISRFLLITAFAAATFSAAQLRADALSMIEAECATLGASQYEIAFVTAATITGTDSNIATYNSFAASQAGTAYSGGTLDTIAPQATTTWAAIVSTTTVSASNNAPDPAGIPVFDTQGNLVSAGTASIYSGHNLNNPIQYTQSGGTPAAGYSEVWTGSTVNGVQRSNFGLGNSNVSYGYYDGPGTSWITAVPEGAQYNPASDSLPIYALSNAIPVPNVLPVPEPAAITSLAGMTVLAAFFGGHWFLGGHWAGLFMRRRAGSGEPVLLSAPCSMLPATLHPGEQV